MSPSRVQDAPLGEPPLMQKTIVCLANSWKHNGSCVAGRQYTDGRWGDWVRPISARAGQEVAASEGRYSDFTDPKVLDIMKVPVLEPKPENHQQENWLLDPRGTWSKQGVVSWTELQAAVDAPPEPLWKNGSSSSRGTNDRVAASDVATFARSLYLLRPTNLVISVELEVAEDFARRRVRARFSLGKSSYRLAVTDPVVVQKYLSEPDGEFAVPEALLCVSLAADVLSGYCYKLVAAVITP